MCMKSLNKGKSQGKSGVGRLIMKCVSCWSKNKLSYTLAPETIKKRASFTTLPLYFDDVKSDKFLSKITEGFDDGEVYETKEVNYKILSYINKLNKLHHENLIKIIINNIVAMCATRKE